jgi:hypothetical protein
MMAGAIVTSALLMDLADIARAEDLIPFDPWGWPPRYPEEAGRAVLLGLDGTIRREVLIDVIEWRDVAAYRFETTLGTVAVDEGDPDDWDWEDDGCTAEGVPIEAEAGPNPAVT